MRKSIIALALAGLDIRVDGRSYAERGIDMVPTTHIGVAAKAIDRYFEDMKHKSLF